MKTYRGERTALGCEVTVDGQPLKHRSDLSGSVSDFDWGFIGHGQLSVAMLADVLGDGAKAKTLCAAFDRSIIAELPHDSWTLTEQDIRAAFAPLVSTDDELQEIDKKGAAFGDMPVETVSLAAPQIPTAMSTGDTRVAPYEDGKVTGKRPADSQTLTLTEAADGMASAANLVVEAANAVSNAAGQVAHACDQPADEPMSTANRSADEKADATNRVVDDAVALARSAIERANKVVAQRLCTTKR